MIAGQYPTSDRPLDVVRVLLDETAALPAPSVLRLLRRYPLRCSSRRGFTIVVGPHLVRLSEVAGTWLAERLPMPASVGAHPAHLHSIVPIALPDGWCVLV